MSKKNTIRNFYIAGTVLAGMYLVMDAVAKKRLENERVDEENPYIKKGEDVKRPRGVYEAKVKPVLDKIISFCGLALLSPLYGLISLAVYMDDPGPVFFTQKRVGKDKHFFMLHKYRSMKMSTPHDVPTHLLSDPDQYITRVGKVLRKTSLDELPQIWDIFCGKMSIIGPRPALWNQEDLVGEREKYGANSVLPGLTGWAQINGRDELEIPVKAELDGEYASWLKQGGWKAFYRDVKCFFATIYSVLHHEGIVEGGTGKLKNVSSNHYISTIPSKKKRILITGAGSYIGERFKEYLYAASDYYEVHIIDTLGLVPKPGLFRGYDVVFNVAGIAHTKETDENRDLYYEVNRDLSVAIAKAAKEADVGQFILLSSMSVYGMTTGRIGKEMVPYPDTAYGESKLSADEAIQKFASESFKVVILRPPMVYGKGCKGNYQMLRQFALKSPVFPAYDNQRSMIYIGNLCEFVKRVIDQEESGLYFPQNADYVNTADMVKIVAGLNGKKINTIRVFNPVIRLAPVTIVKKVFGDLTYEKDDAVGKYDFVESMNLTES